MNINLQLTTEIMKLDRRVSVLETLEIPGNFTPSGILFANASGMIAQDSSLQWNDSADRLIIGGGNDQSLNPVYFDAKGIVDTDTSTTKFGAVFQQTFTPSAQLTTSKFAGVFRLVFNGSTFGTSNVGAVQALRNEVVIQNTSATISGVAYAVDGILRHSANASLANARLFRAIPVLTSGGGVTDSRSYFAESPAITGAGGITTQYGFYAARQKVTGVTTGYGFYQADANDINFYAGTILLQAAGGSKTFLQIDNTSASTDTLIKLTAAGIGSGSYFIRAQDGTPTDIFLVRGDGFTQIAVQTGATNTVSSTTYLKVNSTGTPAANFGGQIAMWLDSNTTVDRNAGVIQWLWNTATDASRRSEMRFFAYDTTNAREAFRIGSTGSAAALSFFGGGTAGKQTVTGSRGGNAALASLLTALANYGFVTDSSSA